MKISICVAGPGCLSPIPGPIFSIPDSGSKKQRCGTVSIFTVPVPTFEKLWFRFRFQKANFSKKIWK
jgi:hypothetical protein